jgi:hypothetical protein
MTCALCTDEELCEACTVRQLIALEEFVDELIAEVDELLQHGGDMPSLSLH